MMEMTLKDVVSIFKQAKVNIRNTFRIQTKLLEYTNRHYKIVKIFHLILKRVVNAIVLTVPDSVEYGSDAATYSGMSGGEHGSRMPAIRKKERDYEGMFEFKKEEIPVIIRHLVTGIIHQFYPEKNNKNNKND